MAKTKDTLRLEQQIYNSTKKQGVFCCYEVTIGWFGKERVDFMTYDTKGIFRCYEIKVSKADFNSKAKLSFVGHYNYYVLTAELYEEVKNDIPSHIGVYVYEKWGSMYCKKKAKKQELKVDEQVLKDSLIRSLSRYLEEKVRSKDETYLEILKRQIKGLERSVDSYHKDYQNLKEILYRKFGGRWKRVLEDLEDKYD